MSCAPLLTGRQHRLMRLRLQAAWDALRTTGASTRQTGGALWRAGMTQEILRAAPELKGNSTPSLCTSPDKQFVFIVLADDQVHRRCWLEDLGDTALICDGTTDDAYFPNLPVVGAQLRGLGHEPHPLQVIARARLRRQPVEPALHLALREAICVTAWKPT